MKSLKAHIQDITTGGRARSKDSDFMDRVASIFLNTSLSKVDISTLSGLSKKRLLKNARSGQQPAAPKRRKDSCSEEQCEVVSTWAYEVCRPSADKALNVFYKEWTSVQEAFSMFHEDHPEWPFQEGKFRQILGLMKCLKDPKHSMCLCIICLNMRLLLKVFIQLQQDIGCEETLTLNLFEFAYILTCNPARKGDFKCSFNRCETCKDCKTITLTLKQLFDFGSTLTLPLELDIWVKGRGQTQDGKVFSPTIKTVKKFRAVKSFLNYFRKQSIEYLAHFYEWRHLAHCEKVQRITVQNSLEQNVMHCYFDISENCRVAYKEAPQASHFSYKSFTLVTFVGFFVSGGKVGKLELFLWSNRLKHDTRCTAGCLQKAFQYIKTKFNIGKFRMHIDNAPQHFRTNDFLHFVYECTYLDSIERIVNYMAKHHGKSIADSAGGFVKRFLQKKQAVREKLTSGEKVVAYLNKYYIIKSKTAKVTVRHSILVPKPFLDRWSLQYKFPTINALKAHYSYVCRVQGGEAQMLQRKFNCVCRFCILGEYEKCEGDGQTGRALLLQSYDV